MTKRFSRGLIFKLGAVLLLLLCIKLLMIGVGIYSAGHLAGDARAINWAGSERMRSYKMSLLINKWLVSAEKEKASLHSEIEKEIDHFENVLKYLMEGEHSSGENRYMEPELLLFAMGKLPLLERLLSLPGIYEPELKEHVEAVENMWFSNVKPLMLDILDPAKAVPPLSSYRAFDSGLQSFVDEVDHLVALLENSSNRKVKLFKSLQYLFLFLTIIITIIALYIIFLVTKKSVHTLMEGIRAMTAGDFSKRIALKTNDEMGELAEGLNFMAEKLEQLYDGLEQKVEEKTSDVEARNRELSILYNTVASLNQSLPLDEILDMFLLKLQEFLGVNSGAIRLFEEDGSLRLAASRGLDEHFKASISFGECLCGLLGQDKVSESWNVVLMDDVLVPKGCKGCFYRVVIEIPIYYREKLLGAVHLFEDEPKDFSAREKLLVENLISHLGAAIEYYSLNIKTRHLAIMEERNMLASELHDSIAQALAYLKIQGSLLEASLDADNVGQARDDLAHIRKGIEKSNEDVRELLLHFRTKIDSEGLEPSIKKLLGKFKRETGMHTVFKAEPDLPVLAPGEEVHLFHIVQEALTNARKYSEASEVSVAITNNGNFAIIIEDNGKGFDLDEVKRKGHSHVGMNIMKERAIRLGGELVVESRSGQGTRVSFAMN
ncbi:MAG: type IV pili methyl-accepting chemotaxis transducer N-terminal domain-containing protein [Proteobacteria bacterium]|nr:type IV pili methyl-accepting chemotaxis transducer N-terminal domain-containing protein [Pseudomonadota bacterium]